MKPCIVLQSDFGLSTGLPASMTAVIVRTDPEIRVYDLCHEVREYDIRQGGSILASTFQYWPDGTIFVSVVDPGVGTDRRSCVALMDNGSYVVTPDNGALTHVKKEFGILEVREIDEKRNRLKNSELSYTFHGRDVFAYTGARLASGHISFEEVGPKFDNEDIVRLELFGCRKIEGGIMGQIDILDVRFGSLWTSIPYEEFIGCGFSFGDMIKVEIFHDEEKVYSNYILYGRSFADVKLNEPIIYMNSANDMAVALNQASFSKEYGIEVGSGWKITMTK